MRGARLRVCRWSFPGLGHQKLEGLKVTSQRWGASLVRGDSREAKEIEKVRPF